MKIELYPPKDIHEIGNRQNQEDAIFPLDGNATETDRLFVLCDGMGGHERGEVASAAISHGLSQWVGKQVDTATVVTDEQVRQAIEHAYQELDAKDNGSFRKAGTTMTMLLFHKGGCTAAHIGDSRIYHMRPSDHSILYISRDHSLVFQLYQTGEITREEMKTHPQKSKITRAMMPGKDNRQKADIVHITDIKPGDYFFLCSDGILEKLDDDELLQILASDKSDEEKKQQLVALTANNDDNHSAYLVHVKDVTSENGDDTLANDEQTVRFNAVNIHPVYAPETQAPATTDKPEALRKSSTEQTAQQESVPTRKSNSRRRWATVIATLAAVIAAGIACWLLLK